MGRGDRSRSRSKPAVKQLGPRGAVGALCHTSAQNSADVEREHQQAAHQYHQADNGGPALR
jgi:hypothetical protein